MPKESISEARVLSETVEVSKSVDEQSDKKGGFSSPQEEIKYLRTKIAQQEQIASHPDGLELGKNSFETARAGKKVIKEYMAKPEEQVLNADYNMGEYESAGVAIGLEPEEHDEQVDQLLALAQERGIKNALKVAQKIGSPHLEDDLHRVLVQYIAEGMPATGLRNTGETWQAMNMSLFEISLAVSKGKGEMEKAEELEKLLGAMEQFYLGMLSVVSGKDSWFSTSKRAFTVEIAVSEGSEEVVFYVAVPKSKSDMFIKNLISMFPDVLVDEHRGDYNIFNNDGEHAAAVAHLEKYDAYPIKVYKKFTHDPLNAILSAFSQLSKHGEGAAIQIIIGDEGTRYNNQYKKIISAIRKGEHEEYAIGKHKSMKSRAWAELKRALGMSKDQEVVDQTVLDLMSEKASRRVLPVAIRVVASAHTQPRARDIVEQITSTFNQFDEGQGNGFVWELVQGRKLQHMMRDFIMRVFGGVHKLALSIEELVTIYHLTGRAVRVIRDLKKSKLASIPAPIEVSESTEGIILGTNKVGVTETEVRFAPKDRMRHFYEIGQTGTGKSFLMRQMIIQDIHNGDGCCYIDPHGTDIMDVLASVPEHRKKDVIYFDPGYTAMPMGLNFMEFDKDRPEQKTFVVNEIFTIFMQLFGKKSPESMGPMFEQYFRNSAMLVLEGMEHGTATIGDISRILSDKEFRHQCLANSKNPVVNQFWEEVAEKAGGEASLENVVPYITAKTDLFMANEIMRPIIAQQKSAFNIADIMNSKKILLVNLSKGRIGDINSELLGLIFVGKILQAALARVDVPEADRHPFYLYIDEFQNFTTPSIATILSEARKYALSLNIAHQYIKQLSDEIRDAVFGNVGTKCIFRISHEDAEFIEKDFATDITSGEIAEMPNRHAYVKMLVNGSPVTPFDIQPKLVHDAADFTDIETLKQASYKKYGRPRDEVEAEIHERYKKKEPEKRVPNDPFASMPGF